MPALPYIQALNTWANESRLLLYNLEDDIDNRSISAYNLQAHGGIGYVVFSLKGVLYDLIESMQYFVYGYSNPFNYMYWWYAHKALYDKEVDITWKAICEAWIKDDFEGRAVTIATIDRMRQLIWDEPFRVQWAARPEEQEF